MNFLKKKRKSQIFVKKTDFFESVGYNFSLLQYLFFILLNVFHLHHFN